MRVTTERPRDRKNVMPIKSEPMDCGDGACTYSNPRDCTLQSDRVLTAKLLFSETVAELFDVKAFVQSSNSINIADLGCAVGPNTFTAMNSIIEAIKTKYDSQNVRGKKDIQFHVFFNDHVSNDFNKLFKLLPCNRQYFAAGVPGSFHRKLFPTSSLHIVHSSYALQWISRIPNELVDKQSPAWNKGRIWYNSAPKEVKEAYSAQFARDMEDFVNARAEELVSGGLMGIILPCFPVGVPPENSLYGIVDLLGDSLMDMFKMGLVSEDKVDSFNFPKYNPTPRELEDLINSNGRFRIVRMELLVHPETIGQLPSVQVFMFYLRAAWEGLIKEHFGGEIIDELFLQFTKKVADSGTLSDSNLRAVRECLVILQKKTT